MIFLFAIKTLYFFLISFINSMAMEFPIQSKKITQTSYYKTESLLSYRKALFNDYIIITICLLLGYMCFGLYGLFLGLYLSMAVFWYIINQRRKDEDETPFSIIYAFESDSDDEEENEKECVTRG